MEATNGRSRVRPIVVDFLATLLATFCIGVTTALVLAACVMLMAGEARGTEPRERATAKLGAEREAARAKAIELAITHQLVTKYTGLVAKP